MKRTIERVEYKRDGIAVLPTIREVCVQIGEYTYLYKRYEWDKRICIWVNSKKTTWFDGVSYHNGVVMSSACTADKLFDGRVKYEGFRDSTCSEEEEERSL